MRIVTLLCFAACVAQPVSAAEPAPIAPAVEPGGAVKPKRESALRALLIEGPELHPSLSTRVLDDQASRHVPRSVLQHNPQHSTESAFVQAIARSGSQGNRPPEGIRSALWAVHSGQRDVGFYGLETGSPADAERLEQALRRIWSVNIRLQRARIHRGGPDVVVVWTDGVSTEVWDAVNASVAQRLKSAR